MLLHSLLVAHPMGTTKECPLAGDNKHALSLLIRHSLYEYPRMENSGIYTSWACPGVMGIVRTNWIVGKRGLCPLPNKISRFIISKWASDAYSVGILACSGYPLSDVIDYMPGIVCCMMISGISSHVVYNLLH